MGGPDFVARLMFLLIQMKGLIQSKRKSLKPFKSRNDVLTSWRALDGLAYPNEVVDPVQAEKS